MGSPWLDSARQALGSLKLKLALTGALIIGASVAVTVVLVLRDAQRRAELSLSDSGLGVGIMSRTLSARVVERQIALAKAAAQWPHKSRPQAAAEFEAVSAYLASQTVLQGLFFSTFLAAGDGRIVASADQDTVRAVQVDIKQRDYFTRTLTEGRLLVSEPLRSLRFDVVEIILSAPVRDAEGRVMAVLGGVLRLGASNFLADMTQATGNEHDSSQTVITDSRGRIIAHPEPGWLLKDAATEPRLGAAARRWAADGRPMEPEASTRRVGEQFVAMAAVPDADWMVFRVASAEVLLGRPAKARIEAAWLGLGVALAGALLIFWAMAWVLRPLQQLERRALSLLDETAHPDQPWPTGEGEIGQLAAVFQHVIEQRAAGQRVANDLLERMQAVMVNAPIGIGFTRRRRFELVGQHYASLFGFTPAELVGREHGMLYPSDEAYRGLVNRAGEAFLAGRVHTEEIEFQRRDGSRFWGYLQGAAVSAGDPLAGTIWIVSDHTAFRKQREQLSWTATHDPLTDLVNRREFESRLQQQLHERRRSETGSALFIDLDGFKAVNDTAGHAAGDAILKDVAAILLHRVREDDTVARLGGDEFAVLLRRCDRDTAEQVAEQIRAMVATHKLQWQDLALGVTTSIGVVEIDDSLDDMAAVLAAADAACYEAKRAGRNVVRVWRGVSPLPGA